MYWGMPGFPVLHYLPEFAQTHVHSVSDAIQPSNLCRLLLLPALSLSQHQGLFQGVGSSQQPAKLLELLCMYVCIYTHTYIYILCL